MKTSSLAATRGGKLCWELLRSFIHRAVSLFDLSGSSLETSTHKAYLYSTQLSAVFSPECFSKPISGNCLISQKPFMKLTKSLWGKGGNLEAELCTCLRQTSDGPKSYLRLTLRFCARRKWRLMQNCKLPDRMLKPCSKTHRELTPLAKTGRLTGIKGNLYSSSGH